MKLSYVQLKLSEMDISGNLTTHAEPSEAVIAKLLVKPVCSDAWFSVLWGFFVCLDLCSDALVSRISEQLPELHELHMDDNSTRRILHHYSSGLNEH